MKTKEKLPTREECLSILKERKLPLNIIHHSLQVNLISIFLANRLKENGLDIDIDLVDRASLLHDIDKLETLHTGEHGYLSEKILAEKGYPLVGKIVKYHRFNFIHQKSLPWEAKIINYADKRVKHDQIVTLKERFEDLIKRYKVVKEDKEAISLFYKLEKDIFNRIHLNPEKLESYLKHPKTAR